MCEGDAGPVRGAGWLLARAAALGNGQLRRLLQFDVDH